MEELERELKREQGGGQGEEGRRTVSRPFPLVWVSPPPLHWCFVTLVHHISSLSPLSLLQPLPLL